MEHLIIPEGYEPALNLHDTQIAIKTVKAAIVKNLDAKTQNKLIDDSISLITRL